MESKTVEEVEVAPDGNESVLSELHERIWSVVSFEKCLEGGITYDEAVRKMDELFEQKVSGLCIITDEAANNL